MLTTTSSRVITRAAASRFAAARTYATPPNHTQTGAPSPGLGQDSRTKPEARAGPSPPAPGGNGLNPAVIGGAAVLAGLGVYFFTRPGDAKQKAGQAEVKARDAAHKAGDALESLKAAGEEKFQDLRSEAEKKADELKGRAEGLKKQGEAKLNEYKRGAEVQYNEAAKESKGLLGKAEADAKALLGAADAKKNQFIHEAEAKKDQAEVKAKKSGWFS